MDSFGGKMGNFDCQQMVDHGLLDQPLMPAVRTDVCRENVPLKNIIEFV